MQRSGIRELMDLAWKTPGCIRLEVGEPNFPTPAHIVEAAIEALRSGRTKYVPNAGIPELREAIATKIRTSNHFEATVDQVTVTVGAVQGLFCTLLALTEPGDRVLLPAPPAVRGVPGGIGMTAAIVIVVGAVVLALRIWMRGRRRRGQVYPPGPLGRLGG
jgi:hypothetical protein